MEVDSSLLQQIATDVLSDMLGLELFRTESGTEATSQLVASIRISGDWQAGLEVLTSVNGSRRLAEQMFELPADELTEEDIADALGEIANMIGGNLKGLSFGETKLSLPCVGPMVPAATQTCGSPPMEIHMQMAAERLSLRLYQDAPVQVGTH